MKIFMLVCDGMADRPVKGLGGKTPLEAARKPNMNKLADAGITGILDPVEPGMRVGSDTTHLALLGYNPQEVYTGRGPIEAAGVSIKLKKGDIAFRCNFATVDKNSVVIDRRAGRIEKTGELAAAINKIDKRIRFTATTAHRGVVVLRGKGLSSRISDSDPHQEGKKAVRVVPLDSSKSAKRTADIVNNFLKRAHEVLGKHEINRRRAKLGKQPANMLLLRGCGSRPELQPLHDKYKISGACIATTAIVKGVARLAGMEVLEPKRDYASRIQQGIKALKKHDFLLMNIKETDEASHDHDFKAKIRLIEDIDKAMKPMLEFSRSNYVAVLSDHTTSVSYGDHTGDPVPVLIAGPEVRRDGVKVFSERDAARGGIGRIKGQSLIQILVDLANRSEKFGA